MNTLMFLQRLARKLISKGLLRDAAELYADLEGEQQARHVWIRRAKQLERLKYYVVAAATYEKLGMHTEAKRCCKRWAKLLEAYKCENTDIIRSAWIAAGEEQKAAKYGRDFGFYKEMGTWFLENGSFVKGRDFLRRALSFRSKLPRLAKMRLAEIYDLLGDFENSRRNYLLAAKELEMRHRSWWAAAMAYKKLGLFDAARACFLKEARIQEKRKNFKEAARCYAAIGNFRRAEQLWKGA